MSRYDLRTAISRQIGNHLAGTIDLDSFAFRHLGDLSEGQTSGFSEEVLVTYFCDAIENDDV